MSGNEFGESANNQVAPITSEELDNATGVDDLAEDVNGQDDATGSLEAEEEDADASSGEGSDNDKRGLPKDFKGLQGKLTQTSQELATERRKAEFYKTMLADPDIAPILQKKLAAMEGRTVVTPQAPQQAQSPDFEETLPDYSRMEPNAIIKDMYNRVYTKVKAEVENMFGTQIKPTIDEVRAEKAQAVISAFFEKVPAAQEYRNELAQIMQTRRVSLEEAWKIFDYDNAPLKAKQVLDKEIRVKKDANMIQSGGGTPSVKVKDRPSATEAINDALKKMGM